MILAFTTKTLPFRAAVGYTIERARALAFYAIAALRCQFSELGESKSLPAPFAATE